MVNKTGVNRNTNRQPHWNGKNPAQIPDAAPRSRTALDPVAYDNLIKQHGVRVKVYRSMFCPNVKSVDGGEHNIDCTLCNGSGYLDVDPIETVSYLANQNFQEEMTVEGYHDGNSVGATFLGGVELQYFTRVDLMDFTQPFYERVLRRADSTKGTGGTPAAPTVPATQAQISITFPDVPGNSPELAFFNGGLNGSFFNVIDNGSNGIKTSLIFGDFNDITEPNGIVESAGVEILFIPDTPNIPRTGTDWAVSVESLILGITTDVPTSPNTTPRTGQTAATLQRLCTVERVGSVITLTTIAGGATTVSNPTNAGGTTGNIISQGTNVVPAVPFIPPTSGDNPDDNLKYDCKRVNVIIDKAGRQYHQDINFRLTPQGNVRWFGTDQPDAQTIYTVHYESVIQYRAISAMHINRFAQVPDRSTGLVAQVKMPEQWMLQKEFLIIRRDKYGDEIQKTGIYGAVIAAQPFNPSPADTI